MLLLQSSPQWDVLFHSGEMRTMPWVPSAWAKPVLILLLPQQIAQSQVQMWSIGKSHALRSERERQKQGKNEEHRDSASQPESSTRSWTSPNSLPPNPHSPHSTPPPPRTLLQPKPFRKECGGNCLFLNSSLQLCLLVLPTGTQRLQTASQHVLREQAHT